MTGGVQFSSEDFYESVVDELAAKKLPQLKVSRVEYHEGGVLSDKRVYLRLARERYSFDICAAPFGNEYFFSYRFVEVPRGGWAQLALIALGLGFIWWTVSRLFPTLNFSWVVILALVGVLIGRWIIREARNNNDGMPKSANGSGEMPDFDSFFLGLPVIGEWYERTRKDTYFRHDTRLLYHSIISEIVKRKVDEFTAAQGVTLLRTYDYNPILGELYKAAKVKPGLEEEEAAA